MSQERLEEAPAGKCTAGSRTAKESTAAKNQQATKIFRTITLIALPLLWAGYFYSLYRGDTGNMNSYMLLVLMFSLLNADILIKGEKLSNKALDILAKINGILLVIVALITIIQLLIK